MIYGFRPQKVARYFLGTEKQNTVFEGECVGQLLAMEMLRKERANLEGAQVTIYVDNQASIKAHHARKAQAGGYIIEEVRRCHEKVRRQHKGIRVRVCWIPGHMDIYGSDLVDAEAKRAAEGAENNRQSGFGILAKGLPDSKSTVRQRLKARTKAAYTQAFRTLPRYQRMAKFKAAAPSAEFRKIAK
ncbi:hypothetical protein BJ912DRAFT_864653 [Pholiota molesta]|nr:hypothetical protein BJ912DRAFT_864653 [Pholiota molesta]